jgi:hypothetical protein
MRNNSNEWPIMMCFCEKLYDLLSFQKQIRKKVSVLYYFKRRAKLINRKKNQQF